MSLTSKLSLTVAQCLSFAKDKLFDRARGALQERGTLKQWTDLIKNGSERTIDDIIHKPTMDSVLFLQDRFEILIDARGFKPEEIKCSITPNLVEVGAHKQDNFNSSNRSVTLTRTYQLPQIVKPEDGTCYLSSEGVLLITAPWLK